MIRQCAWSGEEFEGKGYVLTLVEGGHEVVSEDAFRGGGRVVRVGQDQEDQEDPALVDVLAASQTTVRDQAAEIERLKEQLAARAPATEPTAAVSTRKTSPATKS